MKEWAADNHQIFWWDEDDESACSLVILLTFPTDYRVLLEYDGAKTFVFKPVGNRQATWPSTHDTYRIGWGDKGGGDESGHEARPYHDG